MERKGLWLVLGLVVGCAAPSGSGVPALDAAALPSPTFPGLRPRALALKIVDARQPLPETTQQMVAELERALATRLRKSGFEVTQSAHNKLGFVVAYKDQPLPDYEREDCLLISARIETPQSFAEAEGSACFEWRNLYGMDLGGDPSKAYHTALSGVLDMLDRTWSRVNGAKTASLSTL